MSAGSRPCVESAPSLARRASERAWTSRARHSRSWASCSGAARVVRRRTLPKKQTKRRPPMRPETRRRRTRRRTRKARFPKEDGQEWESGRGFCLFGRRPRRNFEVCSKRFCAATADGVRPVQDTSWIQRTGTLGTRPRCRRGPRPQTPRPPAPGNLRKVSLNRNVSL